MGLVFTKYEGLGNDFVVVDAPAVDHLSPDDAVRICDRHRGVGGDGVLLVVRETTRPRMVVLNADGSRPEMCGNGLRCVALHLMGDAAGAELEVETDAGTKACSVERSASGSASVSIEMGRAVLKDPIQASWNERAIALLHVDIGNPHAITFELRMTDEELDRFGPAVSQSVAGGTNVEIAHVESAGIKVDVWERGVGRTRACGTGACATAAAAASAGLIDFDRPVDVRLPGGALRVTVRANYDVLMQGPARRVFAGEM